MINECNTSKKCFHKNLEYYKNKKGISSIGLF